MPASVIGFSEMANWFLSPAQAASSTRLFSAVSVRAASIGPLIAAPVSRAVLLNSSIPSAPWRK
jgi:hypothetical protein